MQSLPAHVNPFALMLNPQAVLARIGASDRLERLQRHVCRPLDKVMLGATPDGDDAVEPLTASQTAERPLTESDAAR
jgi:hypothetical protein